MLTAARYANGEPGAQRPQELILIDRCRQWNTLPRSGGILDQPYGLLDRLQAIENIVGSIQQYNANWDKGDWITANPEIMRIMTRYWELRDKVENG